MTFPNYTKSETLDGNLDLALLHQQILGDPSITTVFLGATQRSDDFTLMFESTPSTAEQAQCDIIVSVHNIFETNKQQKIEQIDEKTQELIALGFAHDGEEFSLSSEAQLNWLGLQGYTPPVEVTTIDDKAYSVADINLFVQTAGSTKQSHLDSGRALKQQVLAAPTQQDLDAITDNR